MFILAMDKLQDKVETMARTVPACALSSTVGPQQMIPQMKGINARNLEPG